MREPELISCGRADEKASIAVAERERERERVREKAVSLFRRSLPDILELLPRSFSSQLTSVNKFYSVLDQLRPGENMSRGQRNNRRGLNHKDVET
jgi:hypothetical protein